MKLFLEFSRRHPNAVFIAVVLGVLAGLFNALLVPVIVNGVLRDPQETGATPLPTVLSYEVAHAGFATLFFALCGGIFACRLASRLLLTRVSMEVMAHLRMRLCQMTAAAPIEHLESVGPARLTSVLMEDVAQIVLGGQLIPGVLTSVATLAGTLGFLAYVNVSAFRFVIAAIAVGVLSYQAPMSLGGRLFRKSRRLYDTLHEAVHGLVHGAKELKLDARKREYYFAEILRKDQRALLDNDTRAFATFIAAGVYGDMIGFFAMGVLAFVFVNYHSLSPSDVIGLVMALLYVTNPLSMIMNAMPQLAAAQSAYRNVEEVLGDFAREPVQAYDGPVPGWRRMTLAAATYAHRGNAHHDGFKVGPVDLVLERGQVTFIVGGNGSGKSTLSKIISLHYPASSGEVAFDDQSVGPHNVEAYRQTIGTIFTDYHLFDRLLRHPEHADTATVEDHLARLGLQGKVRVDGTKFSMTRLSDGQRKRLALLVALLDDKSLYVFDEWAADQDPEFKEVFYRRMLPELRARDKAVVVISHDDRYFDVADRIVVLEDGRAVPRARDPAPRTPLASAEPR